MRLVRSSPEKGLNQGVAGKIRERKQGMARLRGQEVQEKLALVTFGYILVLLGRALTTQGGIGDRPGVCEFFWSIFLL